MSQSFLSLRITRPRLLGALAILASVLMLVVVYKTNVQKGGYRSNDIFFIWSDGHDIAHGKNPYASIHGSDMLKNKKYSTYLPGFFLLVSAYVSLGYETFDQWMSFWRPTSFAIHVTIGTILFYYLLPLAGFWCALFASQFWLLSRWTVQIMNSGQIDAAAMLVMLISLMLLPNRRKTALVLFGLSLSLKQIGVFMLPVYLLLGINSNAPLKEALKQIAKDLVVIAAVPTLLCLPFFIADPVALLKSLLFSATRSPGGHIKVDSIDALLGYVGLIAKLPMLALMGMVYMLVLERRVGAYVAGLLLFLTFMSFNSVLFKQYMPWFCLFVGLATAEWMRTEAAKGRVR